MNKIVFVGANSLLEPVIKIVSEVAQIIVCEESDVVVPEQAQVYKLKKSFFGLRLNAETSLPYYQIGLGTVLKKTNPDTIIVMDFIRLWYWQVMWYRLWNRKTRVVVYVETQRLPRGFFHKLAFYVFWFFFKLTQQMVNVYAVYTELGRQFATSFRVIAPVVVLPVPIDTAHFIPAREKDYMKDGELRILFNARYVPYKRHVDVLQALSLVTTMHKTPISISFIGRGGDRAFVEDEVNRLNLGTSVNFVDTLSREEVVSLYQSHDVLILPSDGEAIGMVVPEAMACGLPTITSDTVGANVYVKEGVTGFTFRTGKVSELAELIGQLLDRELGFKMGENARKVIENFSEDSLRSKFKDTLVTSRWTELV